MEKQGSEFRVNDDLTPAAQCGVATYVERLHESGDINRLPRLEKLKLEDTYEWLVTPVLTASNWTALVTKVEIVCAKLTAPIDLQHCTRLEKMKIWSELSWSPDEMRSSLASMQGSPVWRIDMRGSTVSPDVYSCIWEQLPGSVRELFLPAIAAAERGTGHEGRPESDCGGGWIQCSDRLVQPPNMQTILSPPTLPASNTVERT